MKRVLVPFDLSPQAPAVGAEVHAVDGQTMGTTWSVKYVAPRDKSLPQIKAGIQQQLDEVVAQMSTWEPDSALSRFNRAADGAWHALPPEFFQVLQYALQVAEHTQGACDVTAGALVNLWGFGPVRAYSDAAFAPPAGEALAAAQARCGWQRLQLDSTQRRVRQPGGIHLDLSAIAKGFGVDQVARYLQRNGIDSHLIEVGGELRGAGVKPDGQPWWVALEQAPVTRPAAAEIEATETLIALHGLSVATSGDYRRYFERNGTRYCHTIDPRSGRPINNDLASVTVVHRDCMASDALSTALTVMGVEQGLAYAQQHHLAALFVRRTEIGFDEYLSESFAAMLQ